MLDAVAAGTPLLGICLGLQLFFERGNEGVPADEGAVADGNTPEQAGGPWSMAWVLCAVRARVWSRAA